MKKLFVFAATCVLLGSAAVASAAGDAAAGKQKSATCAACHNADGNSVNPEWPKLAGQNAGYLVKQLQDFQMGMKDPKHEGARLNPTMGPMAMPLSAQDMEDLAAYFASQTITPGEADPNKVALGEKLYRGGDLIKGIPACNACHGPTGAGNPAAKFPALAGQHAKYVELQLKAFRGGQRANDAGQMMRDIAAKMSDAEIEAVASYVQGLRP
ncbi:MAG TPA: c-type cytochrome [Candidatus Competibacteraceae bacterium]|nr:c-type cytochrome [Candidatus Competibacteraceae bacterium]